MTTPSILQTCAHVTYSPELTFGRPSCDRGLAISSGFSVVHECPHCRAPLHACRNCAAYDETARYGCREPQAEPPHDKDAANYCDFFVFRKGPAAPKEEDPRGKALAALDALFKK